MRELSTRKQALGDLDLKSEPGLVSLRALLAEADAPIENMRLGKLEASGFRLRRPAATTSPGPSCG